MNRMLRMGLTLLSAFVLFACPAADDEGGGGDGDDGDGEALSSGSECEAIIRHMANVIDDRILNSLNNGTFNDVVVNGVKGSATVNGSETYTQTSGTNSVSSTYTADIDIDFDGYKEYYGANVTLTLTGPVSFYYYRYSNQSGTNFYSSTTVRIEGSKVDVAEVIDYSAYGSPNSVTVDTITFRASNDNLTSSFSGTCTPKDGLQYAF